MKIHRLTHVGFVTSDIEGAVTRWEDLFNLRRTIPRPTWYAAEEGIHSTMMYVTGAGIEPMQPATPGTPFAESLAAGRSVFHLSLRVDDIGAVARHLWENDIWTQLRHPAKVVAMSRLWIDPASSAGAQIEFIDRAEREVMMGVGEGDAPVVSGPYIDRIRAVTHIVPDLAIAKRLYHDVLGFPCSDIVDANINHWDVSTIRNMRFTVGNGKYGGGEGGPDIYAVEITDPNQPYGQIRKMFGYGLGAWTMEVPDIDETIEHLSKFECWMRVRPSSGPGRLPRRLWVHPRSTGGVPLLLMPTPK